MENNSAKKIEKNKNGTDAKDDLKKSNKTNVAAKKDLAKSAVPEEHKKKMEIRRQKSIEGRKSVRNTLR